MRKKLLNFWKYMSSVKSNALFPTAEHVEVMFQYLDHSQSLTFKAFDGYPNWDTFSVAIKEAFGGAFQMKKCAR